VLTPFTTCFTCGTDLTQPDAHIHLANGNRVCRACHIAKLPPRRTR